MSDEQERASLYTPEYVAEMVRLLETITDEELTAGLGEIFNRWDEKPPAAAGAEEAG